jgi:hypothetical protein
MTWLAWRQFRTQALVAAGALAAVAIAFSLTGPGLAQFYDHTYLTCQAHGDCSSVTAALVTKDTFLKHFIQAMILVPAFIGAFWGAPLLAREFETGSYRLAWTQSISRTRWLSTKLLVVGLAAVVTAGLFSLMATWWSSPLDRFQDNPFNVFDLRDLVPIGYATFALALGVVIGALIRRTLPAMVVTLVGYVAARITFNAWVRPHFASPLRLSTKFQLPFGTAQSNGVGLKQSDWVLSNQTVNSSGKVIGRYGGVGPNGNINFSGLGKKVQYFSGVGRCPNKFPTSGNAGGVTTSGHRRSISVPTHQILEAMQKCANSFHLRELATYQPASRYWMFQWYELGSYLLLSLLLAGFALWWLRRR